MRPSGMLSAFSSYFLFFPKIYKKILVPLVALTSFLTLTPLVFSKINIAAEAGQVTNPERGPAIAIFGIMAIFLVVGGAINLIKKTIKAQGLEKSQFNLISIGTVITFSLIICFNVILPLALNNVTYVPLAPLFILPFIVFTAFSIIKYHLLNIKIIATEILTFSLSIAALLEVLFSKSAGTAIVRFLIFLLILGFGLLLDRSVRKEVEQREQLEILDKELAKANEKLKALDQARAEFISIASHQLRTPPSTVKWYLSAILSGDYGKLPADVRQALTKAQGSNNLLISLIEDMLNVSRIERGTMEFLFEEIDPLQMAKTTYEQLIPFAEEKSLKLNFSSPKESLPKIVADKEKLRQVMNNLIDNAIKYTSRGKIEVSIFQAGPNIHFQVKDTGKGINPTEAKSIFEKFTRGKESIKHSAGLGLGLYVAKIVIEQHKGKIWAESPGEGKGSIFAFTIPIRSKIDKNSSLDLSASYYEKTPSR